MAREDDLWMRGSRTVARPGTEAHPHPTIRDLAVDSKVGMEIIGLGILSSSNNTETDLGTGGRARGGVTTPLSIINNQGFIFDPIFREKWVGKFDKSGHKMGKFGAF